MNNTNIKNQIKEKNTAIVSIGNRHAEANEWIIAKWKTISLLFLMLISPQITLCQSAYIFLAKTYAEEGKMHDAEIYEYKALELLEYVSDKEGLYYAENLHALAEYYNFIHNYPRAIECEIKVSQIIEHSIGKYNIDYVNSLYFLAKYYSRLGNRVKAIELCNQANELLHSFFVNDPNYLTTLSQVAKFYSELNAYSEGLALNLELLDLIKKQLGEEHPYYSSCLSNIAVDYLYLGELEKAKEFETIALDLRGRLLGRNHRDYAVSLDILAMCYSRMGDNGNAIRLCEESKNIFKQLVSLQDADYLKCCSNLAEYYCEIGDYATAIKYNKEAYDIISELLGRNSYENIEILLNRSKYYIHSGQYEEGIKLGYEVLDSIKRHFGTNNLNYATTLGIISAAYSELGNYNSAIDLTTEALQIMEKIVGNNHVDYATFLHLLSGYYYANGELTEAIKSEKRAISIRKLVLGETHPYYATSLGTLSIYYHVIGDYETALSYNEDALTVIKTLGESHKDYATALNNRSLICASLGNLREALELTKEAISIIKTSVSENHAKYLTYLLWLTRIYEQIGDYKNLEESIIEVNKIINKEVRSVFSYLTHIERKNYWDSRGSWLQYNLPYYIFNSANESLNDIGYNSVLLSKGILLNSELEFYQFLSDSSSEGLLEKYNEIKNFRLQLNKLYEKPIAERFCDTDSLERHANDLERALMYESSEFGDYTRNLTVTWEDVRNNLRDKDAAVEFAHFPLNNDSTMYMAYVLRKDMEAPALIKLFEEKELTDLSDAELYSRTNASKLIWQKLQPELEGVENVYFAPDGILHHIAIEYLPDFENSEKYISDRFNIYRLSSTRQLAISKPINHSDNAVIYGGIKYDTDSETMININRKYAVPRGFKPSYNIADSLSTRSRKGYLEHTLTEAQSINQMFKDMNQTPILIIGDEASEESFKNLSGKGNRFIHIATHGFYWEADEADYEASVNERLLFMSQFGDNAHRNIEDKALTRTGLFMAGVNNTLTGKEMPADMDDGILTAQEIANLDLRGLDLVVLSACQTGMGDISSDGVFGLQRGFKKAGANSILMSLWNVDDEATQILMTNFYKNYLSGMSKQDALTFAQKTVRETPGYEDPEFWAAFILLDALN